VLLWEVSTGKLIRETAVPGPLSALRWNPHLEHHVLAVAGKEGVYLVDTRTARGDDREATKALLEGEDDEGVIEQRRDAEVVGVWSTLQQEPCTIVKCALAAPARTVAWHARGDYLATVSPDAIASMQCVVHRCSRRSSQAPLKRGDKGGQIQSCVFHPSKPFLFVASRTTVRLYHLARQELVKTLRSGCKWISCLAIHPGGDHCVVGSRDLRLCWHDLDLGEQAHRTLKYHDKALRAATFHPKSSRYPLMATCSDDGTVQVFHAKVFDDLTTNPSIVPVKRLDVSSPKGCLDCAFHPTQPWLFSGSADGSVKLFHAL